MLSRELKTAGSRCLTCASIPNNCHVQETDRLTRTLASTVELCVNSQSSVVQFFGSASYKQPTAQLKRNNCSYVTSDDAVKERVNRQLISRALNGCGRCESICSIHRYILKEQDHDMESKIRKFLNSSTPKQSPSCENDKLLS
jgi:hypothetical protein